MIAVQNEVTKHKMKGNTSLTLGFPGRLSGQGNQTCRNWRAAWLQFVPVGISSSAPWRREQACNFLNQMDCILRNSCLYPVRNLQCMKCNCSIRFAICNSAAANRKMPETSCSWRAATRMFFKLEGMHRTNNKGKECLSPTSLQHILWRSFCLTEAANASKQLPIFCSVHLLLPGRLHFARYLDHYLSIATSPESGLASNLLQL